MSERMEPGRWWRVIAADESLWCETSDESEARAAMRAGDKLQRLYRVELTEWRNVEASRLPLEERILTLPSETGTQR